MKIQAYTMRKIALAMIVFLISITSVFAQADNSKIKDGTVTNGAERAKSGAILELESNSKGMLISRLTTPQRDDIIPANLSNGLLIFNTTTGCFDFWNQPQNMWLSMCGTQPPANATVSTTDCGKVIANGTYKQGTALAGSNYLSVPVTVTQPGTYTITANTANGYYFSSTGAFPSAGSYVLTLTGVGTPNKGYDTGNTGDAVTISINGIAASCKPNVFVAKADVDFALTCNTIALAGTYNIGLPLTSANKLTLSVNVSNVGYWSANTNTINGYSFTGSGTFTKTGVQTVELLGTGTPLVSGANSFTISSNAATAATCNNIVINVATVGYALDCSKVTQSGTYMVDTQLIAANKIILSVNVTATGKATISTNTVNGMTFTTGEINLSALGQQEVTLLGSGKPITAGASAFTVTGTTGVAGSCSLNVTVMTQPIAYVISCGSITTSGSYMPGTAMTTANTMTVPVTVTYPGAYTMSTNSQNGISFSASGTFAAAGTQNVVMKATGTPVNGSSYTFTITSNSTSATCTKNVDFMARMMNVLYVNQNNDAFKLLLQSKLNFGPTGKYVTNGVNVISLDVTNDQAGFYLLRTTLNEQKIDVIYFNDTSILSSSNDYLVAILNKFVNGKKGVVIHTSRGINTNIAKAINGIIGGGSSMTASLFSTGNSNIAMTSKFVNVSDPTLIGPFGDVRNLGLGGAIAGSTFYGLKYLNNVIALSYDNYGNNVSAARHASLGYLYASDAFMFEGTIGETRLSDRDALAVLATGLPVPKLGYGAANFGISVDAYNSAWCANIFAWAFDYVQANSIVDYPI
jgi:hypothetical protein